MTHHPRSLGTTLGAALSIAFAVTGSFDFAQAAERNIVLIVTDDQGPDFGAYGNLAMKTPNLDSLAAEGVLFRRAFCTTASCSASRSVILTGLHNHANGQYGHAHDLHKFNSYTNIVSLPGYLAAAGYRTARVGKYHVAPESVYPFDRVIGGSSRSPVVMAENCRALLEEADARPFFLYFCTADPHRDDRIADELPRAPNRFGNPPSDTDGYPGVIEVPYDPMTVVVPGFLPDTETCRAELAQYYQSCARIDQGVGKLLGILTETGHSQDTLVVFLSDHGIAMPGAKTTVYEGGLHAPLIVRDPYQDTHGVETDAMVSWVDLTPTLLDFAGALDPNTGAVKDAVLSRLPAAADGQETGKTQRGRMHGRSFLSIVANPEPNPEPNRTSTAGWDEVYASHTFHEIQMYYPMRVVRERRLKLIWNIAYPLPFPFASDLWAAPTWQAQYRLGMDAPYGKKTVGSYIHRPQFELYDLVADPDEGTNLAVDPAFSDELKRLKAKLKSFQRRTNDPWISKWEYE